MERFFDNPGSRIARLLLLMAALYSSAYCAEWRLQVVDPGGGGTYSSMAIDREGNAHVAYIDDVLRLCKYAFWDHRLDKWFVMRLDTTCGGFTSLALDSKQYPHVAYLEYGTGRLKYAHWDGSSWHIQPILLSARLLEFYTSITIDADDHPVISYYEVLDAAHEDYSLHLRTARYSGSFWEVATIDGTKGSGKFNSLAKGPDGQLQAAYSNVRDEHASVRYAHWNGESWDHEVLEGLNQAFYVHAVSITVDNNSVPHIAYSDVANHRIRYATRQGGKWQFQNAASVLREAYPDRYGIAVDSEGNPYISFYDAGAGVLKVAHKENGRWVTEAVDGNSAGYTNSLRISKDEILITYLDPASNSLKCARHALTKPEVEEKTLATRH
jgi:hypothetical protein